MKEKTMSRRSNKEKAEESATPDIAAANFESAERNQVRGAIDDGDVVVDASGVDTEFEPETNAAGETTLAAAEAENTGRLARGEDPVVENVESENLEARPEANQQDILPEDTGGEDTMAVRQSNVDRLVDGKIVRGFGEEEQEVQRQSGQVSDQSLASADPSAEE